MTIGSSSVPPRRAGPALAALSLAAHASFTAAAAAATGADWKDLALRYDGHMYLLIAKTLPRLYVNPLPLFPALKVPGFLTACFPLYPLLIRLAGFFVGDLRVAALAVSWAASAAAAWLFYILAGRFTDRPALAGAAFVFFPPMGLVAGGMSFVEPVFVLTAVAAVLAVMEDRPWACAAACAAAMLAQKSGVLVPVIALLIAADGRGKAGLRRFAPVLASAAAPAALQLYLWHAFGDALINVKIERVLFGGVFFGVPFRAFLRGLLSADFLGGAERRAAIAASGAFYLGVAAAAWRRGDRRERPLLIWLSATLAFYFSLDGGLAFQGLTRYLLLGAPAAILLALPLLPRGERRLALAAPLLLLPYFLGIIEVAQNEALARASGTAAYFAAFSAALR